MIIACVLEVVSSSTEQFFRTLQTMCMSKRQRQCFRHTPLQPDLG